MDYAGPRGVTPAMWACRRGHFDILSNLIERSTNGGSSKLRTR